MYFRETSHPKYPKGFFVSDNRRYGLAIGFSNETIVFERRTDWVQIHVTQEPAAKVRTKLEKVAVTDPKSLIAALKPKVVPPAPKKEEPKEEKPHEPSSAVHSSQSHTS